MMNKDTNQNRYGLDKDLVEFVRDGLAANPDLLPTLSPQSNRLFKLVHRSAGNGLTVPEAARVMGKTPNAASRQFVELKKAGYIARHGSRQTPAGRTAGVYRVTLAGVMLVDSFITQANT